MPTNTFFRLPETKQERIMEAAKAEIARVPYENFSIGEIIRSCGISRGSFYQYFSGKEDIYLYLLSGYHRQITDRMIEELQKNGGSYFDALEATFRFAVRMLCYKDSKAFRHNLFCNMRLYEILWQGEGYSETSLSDFERVKEYTDLSRLNLTQEEFVILVDMIVSSMIKELAGIVVADDTEQRAISRFSAKIAILRRAYEKNAQP